MKKHIQAVFEKPMDRKEFLGYMGAAFLAVIGVSGMLKAILHHGAGKGGGLSGRSVADGYGSSSYGGGKKSLAS